MEIYIHRDGQQLGPYPFEKTREYLASGQLLASDLAWHEGAPAWAPLAEIKQPATDPVPATVLSQAETPHLEAPAETLHAVVAEVETPTAEEPAAPGGTPDWIPPRRSGPLADIGADRPQGRVALPEHLQAHNFIAPTPVQHAPQKRSSSGDGMRRAQRAMAVRNMMFGALWAFGGTVVTVVTYERVAFSTSGGGYYVAWGAMIFGGLQFVRGAFQYSRA